MTCGERRADIGGACCRWGNRRDRRGRLRCLPVPGRGGRSGNDGDLAPELHAAHGGTCREGARSDEVGERGTGPCAEVRVRTFASEACSETVGPVTVSVDVFLQDFGFGGVLHPTELHPTGIGGGVVVTGTSASSGAPVDSAHPHKGQVYAVIVADGPCPTSLTTISRQIYGLLP